MPLWLVSLGLRVRRAWSSLTPYGKRVTIVTAVAIVAGAAIVFYIVTLRRDRTQLRERVRALALDVANDSARLDTLRHIVVDSTDVLTRLVVQQRFERDAIDAALKQSRTATLELRGIIRRIDTVTVSSIDTVRVNAADDRTATFDVRSTPYTLHAVATLPPSGRARLDSLRVELDTARISARLGCDERANADGIKRARIALTSPPWLSIVAADVQQDPSVCANASREIVQERRAWYRPTLSAGYGITYDVAGKRMAHGPTLGLVWRLAF